MQPTSPLGASAAAICAATAMILALSTGSAVAQAPAPRATAALANLVPAQFNERMDAQGFRWDIDQMGRVQRGTDSCFSGAFVLMVNGNNNFQWQQPGLMTADGSQYVIRGNQPNLECTRYIKVDPKAAGIRYVDVFRNTGTAAMNLSVMVPVQLGNDRFQSLTTDKGTQNPPSLGKQESGLVMFALPQSGQLSLIFYLASPRSAIKPTIQVNNQTQINYTYTFPAPPGRTVALAYGVAQSRMPTPPDAKGVAAMLKPFAARAWLQDLPAEIRRAIVNLTSGFGFSDIEDWDDPSLAAVLGGLDSERGTTDVLAIGPHTRLKGTAVCTGLSVESRYGPLKTSLDQVAAVLGGKGTGRRALVVFRDGQVLSGKLKAQGLRFTTNTGLEIQLADETLDRLMMRADPAGRKPAAEPFALLQTSEGERLALAAGQKQRLSLTTPWGPFAFVLDDVLRLSAASEPLGYRLALRDGTRLFGYLDTAKISVPTAQFGPQTFSPLGLREIRSLQGKTVADDGPVGITSPYVLLTGDNVLVGPVDLSAMHFLASGQKIAVPPGQIRHLRLSEEQAGSEEGRTFEGELWDGGTLSGRLQEVVLPVRGGEALRQVPVRDILEIHVPTPTVPEMTRNRVAELIRDLGHAEYEKRKAAAAALAELGHLAKPQLSEAVQQTLDPEVRRAGQALLEELKE